MANNGVEACEMIRTRAFVPDLIFMDVFMPEMDGLQAAMQIRALQKQQGQGCPYHRAECQRDGRGTQAVL